MLTGCSSLKRVLKKTSSDRTYDPVSTQCHRDEGLHARPQAGSDYHRSRCASRLPACS